MASEWKVFSLVCGLTMLTLRRGQLSWRKNPSWIPTKGWHRKSRTNCTRANLFPSAQPMCVPTRGWWGWSCAPWLDTTNPNLKNNILDSFRTAVKSWLRCFYCLPLLAIAALTKLAAHLLRAITATIAGYYYNATIVLPILDCNYCRVLLLALVLVVVQSTVRHHNTTTSLWHLLARRSTEQLKQNPSWKRNHFQILWCWWHALCRWQFCRSTALRVMTACSRSKDRLSSLKIASTGHGL